MSRVLRAAALAVWTLCALGAWAEEPDPDWAPLGAEASRLLSGLIRIDTTNPPGNELPAAEYLRSFFAREGIPARLYVSAPNRANVVARLSSTRPGPKGSEETGAAEGPLLLLSHLDVVPADPNAWSFPPFSGAIRDGYVYGRGALDDKGQAVVFALALALLEREGGPRRRELVYCASADEEVDGGAGVHWMIEHHWQELGPPVAVWNEGGASANIPLLESTILNAIGTAEKRALWSSLHTEGIGGHGSQPVPDGANERLVRALARIDAYSTPLRVTPTVAETFRRIGESAGFPTSLLYARISNPLVLRLLRGPLEANRITNAMLRDTIALTGLRSGLKHNLIPRTAEAMLDIRLLPGSDDQAFLARLAEVIDDPQIRIEPSVELPVKEAPASPWEHELFQALETEMAVELPGSVTAPLQTPGSSDSLFFRERGVPSYGYLPALLSDELNASVHGVDERMPVAELERAVRITYRVLRRLVE